MRLTALAALLSLAFAAAPASAHVVEYIAHLTGPNESPPNSSTGNGWGHVFFDDDNWTMRVVFDYAGLVGTSTNAHIHCCTTAPLTGTAGVATQVPRFDGMVNGVHAGHYDNTFDLTLASSWNPAFITVQGNLNNAFAAFSTALTTGKTYLNIHSSTVPGGEIRGFLTVVPEPESYGLMLAGLGVVALTARRRRAA